MPHSALDENAKDGEGPALVVPSEEDRSRCEALLAEIARVREKLGARKSSRSDFQQWLTHVPRIMLEADLPGQGFVVHVPLNEGHGETVRSRDSVLSARVVHELIA